ncbi:piggyBac transposable element-derived protein 4-like [Palaemon carinicauda]|uniref:piggyBac transposable element-derived protein 4-like n=1 Tax=Palaemon carinicauda TaxID=392227 RepID=UPI0035B62856
MASKKYSLGINAINQLLKQLDSDVENGLELNDVSDEEYLNVRELEHEVREEEEMEDDPEIIALGNGMAKTMTMRGRIEPGGPTSVTLGAKKMSDIFSLFLDDRMLAEIVLRSNERLALLRSNYHQKGNVALRDIDLRELKAFIGILIMSAVRCDNHTPTCDMWDLTEGNPLYRCTMNERRFTLLVRVLRFDDSATRAEKVKKDRLTPIRKVFDHVVANCRSNYSPGPHLTDDEQLVPFRGHCPFKMYIPNKPTKYGIKLVLAYDADFHYM